MMDPTLTAANGWRPGTLLTGVAPSVFRSARRIAEQISKARKRALGLRTELRLRRKDFGPMAFRLRMRGHQRKREQHLVFNQVHKRHVLSSDQHRIVA